MERLRSSTLLEDRRDACRGLKAMSKKFRVEVGAQAMNDLVEVSQESGRTRGTVSAGQTDQKHYKLLFFTLDLYRGVICQL